jgi:hypothetical protein
MGWFAPAAHSNQLEQRWVEWDRLILSGWGFQRLIEIAGPAVPFVLELSYLLVYAVGPFGVALLYATGRRLEVRTFLLFYILGLFLSYAQFPFWPSEPPRSVFPGELLPFDSLLRRANLLIVGKAGIHTSVFPSGHVSGVFAAAFAMWTILRTSFWIRYGLVVYSCLVASATVYGRYHYAVDAAAGIGVAIIAAYTSRWLMACDRATSAAAAQSPSLHDPHTSLSAPY